MLVDRGDVFSIECNGHQARPLILSQYIYQWFKTDVEDDYIQKRITHAEAIAELIEEWNDDAMFLVAEMDRETVKSRQEFSVLIEKKLINRMETMREELKTTLLMLMATYPHIVGQGQGNGYRIFSKVFNQGMAVRRHLDKELASLCEVHPEGTPATQVSRARILRAAAQTLKRAGYGHLGATGLSNKHVKLLLREWGSRGLSDKTIKNRLGVIRWWAVKMGRQSCISPDFDLRAYKAPPTQRVDQFAFQKGEPAASFKRWVQDGISSGELKVNCEGAMIHMVEDGMALVSPIVFHRYVQSYLDDAGGVNPPALCVQRDFIKSGWHSVGGNKSNFQHYEIIKRDRVVARLTCLVVRKPEDWMESVPEVNPVLRLVQLL